MAKITVKVNEAYQIKEKKEQMKKVWLKKEERRKQRQARLAQLAEKRAKGRLTLDDVFEQQQIILDTLNELLEERNSRKVD